MEFWASAEVHQPADAALDKVRRLVVPFLNAAFSTSNLAAFQCEIRYIPIVMPADMHSRYPARSRLRRKARLYDCAPILDYEVFVEGALKDQLEEYLRGLALSAPSLAKLGASPAQTQSFKIILETAAERILAGPPN